MLHKHVSKLLIAKNGTQQQARKNVLLKCDNVL